MTVSLIAAMGRNRVIGRQGAIPWHLPQDLRRFRELTLGQTLLMGRRTFESIGGPLPGRKCIVLTRQSDYRAAGCQTADSLDRALSLAKPAAEVFVCGGGEIYRQTLPLASRIYLTEIDLEVAGDSFFPEIPADEFELIASENIAAAPPAVLRIFARRPQGAPRAADEDR